MKGVGAGRHPEAPKEADFNRPIVILSIEKLHYERFHHPDPRVQQRCEIVYLKVLGFSHQDIGRIAQVSQPAVRRYLEDYQAGGLDKLKEVNAYRPTSELNDHRAALEEEFTARPPQTINEAMERIEQLTGLRRSPTQVRTFLKGLGLKRLKVGQIPARPTRRNRPNFLSKSSSLAWRKPNEASDTCSLWMRATLFCSPSWAFCGVWRGFSFRPPAAGSG